MSRQIEAFHFRLYTKNWKTVEPWTLSPFGGMCVAVETGVRYGYHMGVSFCSVQDRYDKSVGLKYASDRASRKESPLICDVIIPHKELVRVVQDQAYRFNRIVEGTRIRWARKLKKVLGTSNDWALVMSHEQEISNAEVIANSCVIESSIDFKDIHEEICDVFVHSLTAYGMTSYMRRGRS
jgi:hypothetical protein